MREAKRDECIEDPGNDSRQSGSGDSPAEEVGGEAGEREAAEDRQIVSGDRSNTYGAEWKKEKGDPVQVLAIRERVSSRVKRIRVEEMQRLMERRVPVPVENPCVDVGVAGPRHRAIEVR